MALEAQELGNERDALESEYNGLKAMNDESEAATNGGSFDALEEAKKAVEKAEEAKKAKAELETLQQKYKDKAPTNEEGVVVDTETDKPLTLYHGTEAAVTDISQLESGHRRADGEKATFNGDGVSFTPDETVASEYGNNVFSGTITLKKPYIMYGNSNMTEEEAKKFSDKLKAEGYDGIIVYPSEQMRSIGVNPMEVVVFDVNSVTPDKKVKEKVQEKSKEQDADNQEEQVERINEVLSPSQVGETGRVESESDSGHGSESHSNGENTSTGKQQSAVEQGNQGSEQSAGGRGNLQPTDERKEGEEVDEHGIPFVLSSNATTTFGEISEDSGLSAAPIKLSNGFQDEATGKGYGLAHMEYQHGEQIRNAGFASVEDFVSYVAENYDHDNIRVGKRREDGMKHSLFK